jgi:alkanesulfonate monooxygenase SsuD/methylene tetrahydromethanopterin reductase-like flavin-dependent oxidoreductase (luciferase family)
MAKTRFGVFSLSQFPDLSKVVESFDDDLGFFELAEQLGYDKVWIAEHLFSTYGLVTSTQVYAAAIAQRTKKIRIGMAVCAIPFNHPLRTASDFALVDILSHGRLDFGVGRAYQPHEFIGLGVPMEKSREMLAEGLDILLKAWTQQRLSYQGKFWTIPEPVEVLPKPVQKPHPPVYQATISPESFEQAARGHLHL